MTVKAVIAIERGEIHLLDGIHDRPHQVIPRQPVPQIRKHQKRLIPLTLNEILGHTRSLISPRLQVRFLHGPFSGIAC
jgi:hypothetical protein